MDTAVSTDRLIRRGGEDWQSLNLNRRETMQKGLPVLARP